MLNKLKPTIGIIDSGIGGISVLNQLISKYHAGNYIYFADNLYMPYGNMDKVSLKKRIGEIINFLKTYKVDLIIIACNTASCVFDDVNTPNIVKMQFNKTDTYFATVLTKNSLKDCNVISDKTLAKEIEDNIFNKDKLNKIIRQNVKNHKLNKLKKLTLACTHYELVKDIFKKYCRNTEICSNSRVVVNKIDLKLEEKNLTIKFIMSKQDFSFYEKLLSLVKMEE